ncbi:siderophore ABC transporter substrate-binding protein [Alkalicoccobacillus murimartini]|uniref:Iron complex transport system substrate-binding protein n=1 Tax=Alkalicoccobacillus murimartini TaxID=171685 RepID=A0ABT9YKJ8_9BACI|nr:siderophore ABC transporter substrate-binding protein [Alkalicoccobacillus murimartini]MDQ0207554.1 iron complex transport system substrate-binding protein [Alkalicoccobacillus murimartini]
MKKQLLWALTAFTAVGLAACGGDSDSEDNDTGSADAGGDTPETIEVESLGGEMVEVPVNPETVVSFDNGVTDSIRAIGGTITGVPKANNVPSYLSEFEGDEYEDVGSLFEPNFELINEMQPDVIFISGRASDNFDELNEIAPTVYLAVDQENFMESFESNMHVLGDIFDAQDQVDEQLAGIQETISEVNDKASNSDQNALILSVDEGSVSAFGEGSRFGIIHGELGIEAADEISAENHGETVNFEYIDSVNPDNIFVVDRGASIGNEASASETLDNDIVNRTNAAQNDQIHELNAEVWYLSGSGLESVKIIVDEINEYFEG